MVASLGCSVVGEARRTAIDEAGAVCGRCLAPVQWKLDSVQTSLPSHQNCTDIQVSRTRTGTEQRTTLCLRCYLAILKRDSTCWKGHSVISRRKAFVGLDSSSWLEAPVQKSHSHWEPKGLLQRKRLVLLRGCVQIAESYLYLTWEDSTKLSGNI